MKTTPSRLRLRSLLAPVVFTAAAIYFLIDAVFALLLRPLARWLGRLSLYQKIAIWVQGLGPYPTLLLFAVPVVLLEPIKPVGAYLIATGRVWSGVVLIVAGEIVKVATVERLFAMSKNKLLTIPAFAWCYGRVIALYAYVQSFGAWQMMKRWVGMIRLKLRRMYRRRFVM